MDIIKIFLNVIFHRESSIPDNIVSEAKDQAEEARNITHRKIENIYAQLNGCVERGDKWFLVPNTTIDECGGGDDHD